MANNLNTAFAVGGYVSIVFSSILVLMSKVKTNNLNDLKERVDILEKEREEAKALNMSNQKAISNLEGQLKTYKEIPLKEISGSLAELASGNHKILNTLQTTASINAQDRGVLTGNSNQVVHEQVVEHQTIKEKK